jgi:hypothetical protein
MLVYTHVPRQSCGLWRIRLFAMQDKRILRIIASVTYNLHRLESLDPSRVDGKYHAGY